MTKATLRWLTLLTLSAWGFLLLYFFFSGRIVAFLHPFFRPMVVVAGFGLVALTIGYWWASRGEKSSHDCCGHDHDHGCLPHTGESHLGRVAAFFILLVPALTAAAFSPDAFGRSAILNRGIILDASMLKRSNPTATVDEDWALPLPGEDGEMLDLPGEEMMDYLPRTPEGYIKAEVVDLIFGAEDAVIRRDFEGKEVEVVGQIMAATEANPSGTRQKLVRMFMVCCAADARPVAVLVDGYTGEVPPEMTWVRVVGKATFPTEGGRRLVVVDSSHLEPTEPPQETMLY